MYRAVGTISNSRTLENRMAQLPHAEALDLYCKEMLGKDYEKQVCVQGCYRGGRYSFGLLHV